MAGKKGRSGGRNRKPTKLKLIEGNRGKRSLDTNEPKPESTTIAPLAWLDDVAKAEWERLAPSLQGFGLLTDHDLALFGAYCHQYSVLVRASKQIEQDGVYAKTAAKDKKPHPAIAAAKGAIAEMRSLSAGFGFTPADRGRLSVEKQDEPKTLRELRKSRDK